ncbi:hypothetical protein M409DRAFT_23260 [Zasmidium cellare ATCC 36951]|uniref:Major facilitator superfamily (MFS) profile domain-containing protein n=1 Tax=Zasmidium cellare ATCC 36951 TaxID=1080233 RepID=A0A6A6CHB2_ZASCE|nr:uncharacterized protein M409DRAFT_23260 [Zasmidium cellare ATCC 36951]KAF2166627.1 hypothetical protein M409DRAFT_23260 [Zasmidium cellare ATCC 36951]
MPTSIELEVVSATQVVSHSSDRASPPPTIVSGAQHGGDTPSRPLTFHLAFLSLVLMVLVASLDTTMLSVALPIITRQLHGSNIEAFWAGLAYILLVAITQPLYTTFSDVTGRKIPLYIAFTLFATGAVIFATAHSMPLLVLGRAVQGLGGGGLDVLNEIILADLTTLKERPLYMGLMAVPMGVGTVAGPIIGAAFAHDASWRWIGWINLPMVGASAALAVVFLRLRPIRASMRQLDFIGMTAFALGCPAVAVPLSIAGPDNPWSSVQILLPLITGFVLLGGLVVYEARPENALFPYRVFRSRSAKVMTITGFLHGLILNPMFYWPPLFFQAVTFATPLRSAVLVLPLCCSLVAAILAAGFLVDLTRKTRLLSWLAWGLLTPGLGLFSLCDARTSLVESIVFQILTGTGIGTLFTVSPLVMQASGTSPDDQGLAVGILVSIRLFGGLIGLALASTVFSLAFASSIRSNGAVSVDAVVKQDPSAAVAFIPELVESRAREEISRSYLDTMRIIWYVLSGLSGLGLIKSFGMEEVSLETEEIGRQHIE